MIRHILTASPEDLRAEAERISLLDEPDREEAILELLQELQFKQELLVWYESEEEEEEDYEDDNTMDLADELGYDNDDDEDSQDSFSW